MTFDNQFVTDSVCCASRSSIFTGEYPHDTHVFTNMPPNGGFSAFVDHGNLRRSFNVYLQRAGYTTAMMGKYLNGYLEGAGRDPFRPSYVPPGWNQWDVAGKAYSEFHYHMNQNGRIRYYGYEAARLPDRRARAPGRQVHRSRLSLTQAVLPGARDVRPACAVRSRPPLPARLPGPAGAPPA